MAANHVVGVGPWGGAEGRPWKHIIEGNRQLCEIKIWTSDDSECVNGIQFTSEDPATHAQFPSDRYGVPIGTENMASFDTANNEHLVEIDGTFGPRYAEVPACHPGGDVIKSLTFKTNVRIYGPYGAAGRGTAFLLPVEEGMFVGFFGRSGDHLESFGVKLQAAGNA